MCSIAVNIPEAVLYDTRMSKEEAGEYVKKAVALQYYTKKGVSIGYCAEIADMPEADFIEFLNENKISIFHFDDEEEFMEEMKNAHIG